AMRLTSCALRQTMASARPPALPKLSTASSPQTRALLEQAARVSAATKGSFRLLHGLSPCSTRRRACGSGIKRYMVHRALRRRAWQWGLGLHLAARRKSGAERGKPDPTPRQGDGLGSPKEPKPV